ncbi:hypothetical protein Q31b_49780 [Novipirellula aureliae]|uniref:Uncharacterized protein n=1 Tax=Novipirellula aureliae TaxID=2527966 RepID=A0A5C6DNZ8_9BACT|nr:hypothetical protein [Novipirellula aureliae]TWU36696.1 hypothetical protein Q31b_49780 [Novipirellula aureliae]
MPSIPLFSLRFARIQPWHFVAAALFICMMPLPLNAQGWDDEDEYGLYGDEYDSNGNAEPTAIKIGSLDLTPLFAPQIDPSLKDNRPLLKQQVEQAFRNGQMATAMELFFGHLVVDYDAASADLDSVKFSPVLKRPVWQSRWAVSLAVRGDQVISKSPILEDKGAMTTRQESMDYDSEFDEMGYGHQDRPSNNTAATEMLSRTADEMLQETLGLVAKVTAEQFTQRFSNGVFGPALASIIPQPIVENSEANGVGGAADPTRRTGSDFPRGRPAPGQMPPESGYEEEYEEDEEEDAFPSEENSPARQNESGFNANPNVFQLGSGMEPFPMWQPGLVYLGEWSSAEAIEMAQKNKIDFVLHFDVTLKEIRNARKPDAAAYTQNISRCRLIRVGDGKTVTVSKPMDNLEAARQKRTSREYVDEQMGNLFAVIDHQLTLQEMPALTPEIVTRRVTALMAGREPKSLAAMAEIRYYQRKGLLSQQDTEKAFFLLGSDDGLKMLYATEEEKVEVIHKWVQDAMAPK